MEPIAVSWLVTSAIAPLVTVLALWTIYIFHTYRRRWRTVDLFLLTAVVLDLMTSIFTFAFAILSLVHPHVEVACQAAQWSLVACRTFQAATLTSMVADRALTVRWPYRYRFSVRRNQIRYHVAVLAIVSSLVGVASVFARDSAQLELSCSLHPGQWDVRFEVFQLALYGVLLVASLLCMLQVEVHRSRHGAKADGSFQLPECASPDLPSATGMSSPLDTQSSTGSTRALHRPSRQASRRPYGKSKSTSDLRWPSVALTVLVCFAVNHLPHLVLSSLALWRPYLWSPWHEASICWLGLLEGFLVPLLLFCRDRALRSALRRAFQRRSGALSPLVGDDGPFQMYFDKDHFRKRGTFGSVTPVGIITNYRRAPRPGSGRNSARGRYALPAGGDAVLGQQPLSKLSCADLTSLGMWREEEEEDQFYATLSDDFSTFSCRSADSALSEDGPYGGSFTTVANDDFEFHDTRPCGGEVRMKPALPPEEHQPVSRNVSFSIKSKKSEEDSPPTILEPPPDIFDLTPVSEDERKDPTLFIQPPNKWRDDTSTLQKSPAHLISPKTTSYSMNDLDLIHKKSGQSAMEEVTFILPVKSESTMSLYRVNVERDLDQLVLTPSRSDTDVNADSGFGSGAQSTNPVWSGFLCRKPSDPFWNMRKPSVSHLVSSGSPAKSYTGMVLHPRMRKIPWISAWKKLDENSIHNERRHFDESPQTDEVATNWNHDLLYEPSSPPGLIIPPQVGIIEEEMSESGTPVYPADYNLDIFAKKSGVLLENAFGKIVRDNCGVQVDFYDEDHSPSDISAWQMNKNIANGICEPICSYPDQNTSLLDDRLTNDSVFKTQNDVNLMNDSAVRDNSQMVFNIFCDNNHSNREVSNNSYGVYENVFTSQHDSPCPVDLKQNSFLEPVYGRLNTFEVKNCDSGKRNSKPQFKTKELLRRESDNRGKKCGIKRRTSRARSDPKASYFVDVDFRSLLNDQDRFGDLFKGKNNVEIEMKPTRPRTDFTAGCFFRPDPKPSGEPPKICPLINQNDRKPNYRKPALGAHPVEARKCENKVKKKIKDEVKPRKSLESGKAPSDRNEGLWANAIPFSRNNDFIDCVNGNSPTKEGKKENYMVQRSPKKSHLPRRDSKTTNDKSNPQIKRKISASRSRAEDGKPEFESRLPRRDHSRSKAQPRVKVTEKQSLNSSRKNEDNFLLIRDQDNKIREPTGKINGNLSSIQKGDDKNVFKDGICFARTGLDHNDNCAIKRLAITDFL